MDVPESTRNPGSVETISPNGDVILVVGPQTVRLRVHSLFLRSASKVFNAMLGPNWSEGQRLSEECPPEVSLEEDNPESLRIICNVIHHQNDNVPDKPPPEQVLEIAIETDKYDLTVAMRYAAAQWLERSDTLSTIETGYLMASAFLFDDADRFATHTLELVLNHTGPYLQLLDDGRISQVLPWKTLCMYQFRGYYSGGQLLDLDTLLIYDS